MQKTLLTVNNGNEGFIFVNSTLTSQMNISEYVAGLMPQFTSAQVQATVAQYTGIGLDTVFDQATAIMGECERTYNFACIHPHSA